MKKLLLTAILILNVFIAQSRPIHEFSSESECNSYITKFTDSLINKGFSIYANKYSTEIWKDHRLYHKLIVFHDEATDKYIVYELVK